MKLFILGATGAIGQHLVKFALEREHEVTAYVRTPRKIGGRHERLKVVEGDVFDVGELARSLDGNDAVLSSFGLLTMRATTLRRDFGRTLAAAMRESEVRRVQVVSAAFLFRDIGLLGGVLKATIFRQMIPDMAGMEAELCQSDHPGSGQHLKVDVPMRRHDQGYSSVRPSPHRLKQSLGHPPLGRGPLRWNLRTIKPSPPPRRFLGADRQAGRVCPR